MFAPVRMPSSVRDGLLRVLPWTAPIALWYGLQRAPLLGFTVERLIAFLLAAIVIVAVARRPTWGIVALFVGVPLYPLAFAFGYKTLGEAPLFVQGRLWKEAVVVGVFLGGMREMLRTGRRPDRIDRLAFGFVGITAVYLLVPQLVVLGSDILEWDARLLGFRINAMFVLVFLGARHMSVDDRDAGIVLRTLIGVGAVIAAAGVYEFIATESWRSFVIDTMGMRSYARDVLGLDSSVPLAGIDIIPGTRISGVFFEPVYFGIFLVIPVALLLAMLGRRGRVGGAALLVPVVFAAMLFTQTRAAVLGALVGVLALLRLTSGSRAARARLGLLVAAGLVVLVPAASATGVIERTVEAFSGEEESTQAHQLDLEKGLEAVSEHPLGLGLGTGPTTGLRFRVTNRIISENAYLQVGNELGVPAMAVFIAFWVSVTSALWRTARGKTGERPLTAGLAAAGVAMLAVGWLQHTWLDFTTAFWWWGGAGVALAAARRAPDDDSSPAEPAAMVAAPA